MADSINLALLKAGKPATCTKEIAQGYIDECFRKFPRLKRWIDSCHAQIKRDGFIYNPFGRKRRLHNIHSADRGVAAAELRSGQ